MLAPQAGDVVNDRIGQAAIVGSDGGDDDLHAGSKRGGFRTAAGRGRDIIEKSRPGRSGRQRTIFLTGGGTDFRSPSSSYAGAFNGPTGRLV